MNPVYLDLHIHTSDDPHALNEEYDLETLIEKVRTIAGGDDFLISLTDHNVINEKIYLDAVSKIGKRIVLGVELHVKAYAGKDTPSYHCHIYFDLDNIDSGIIQDLNKKLDVLYKNKTPEKTDETIPGIELILSTFDSYKFLLLPHGGQSHATFDSAMPDGKDFDTQMERSIYYNFFDGFTSRSNIGTERTIEYLERLGVNEFVNLVTCTDNYDPSIYPNPKGKDAAEFVPTWMYATPNFAGLKLSLTDSSRFEYSKDKPRAWREFIRSIQLKNETLDIDIKLTPGLNVIIGESSSGKTLLVDSLERKLSNTDFSDSKYEHQYAVSQLEIDFPDGTVPHFIGQNFISDIIGDTTNINDIEIIKQIFPKNTDARKAVVEALKDLKSDLESLFDAVENIENTESKLKAIPILSKLVSTKETTENVLKPLLKTIKTQKDVNYTEQDKKTDLRLLDSIDEKLKSNPFIQHDESPVRILKDEIKLMREYSAIEERVREVVNESKLKIDRDLREKHGDEEDKKQKFETLIQTLTDYYYYLYKFNDSLSKITSYSVEAESKQKKIQGHTLSVKNEFALTKDIFHKELNKSLLEENQIPDINTLAPGDIFCFKFKNNQAGNHKGSSPTYRYIQQNIHSKFSKTDTVSYKIKTSEGRDFEKLSPGLKTAVILELVINFEDDNAPLIIDQPEDNLATSYINGDLVKSIKKNKRKKQIIFVSHNATIPMSGDAQNLILCENDGQKITIKSSPLEGKINGKNTVDYVAKITDGGKSSVKKRFKKYDLKNFKD